VSCAESLPERGVAETRRTAACAGRRPGPPRRAADILAITTCIAVVVGAAEGLFWWGNSALRGSLIFLHPGYLWMSVWMQLALLTTGGVILAAVAWRKERWDVATFAVTICSLVGWLNLLVLVPGLQFWAWIIASAGLAAATGRLFRGHRQRSLRIVRRGAPWLVLPFLILPLVQQHTQAERETRRLAALPPAPAGSPNVLLIVLDTVRADAWELYGNDETVAPNLTRLAERGVVFEQAWANAPWTLPSIASAFTGRLPHELSMDWTSALGHAHPTLAEALSGRGWLTGGFVGNTRYCSRETGLARGFVHYEDYRLSWADFVFCTGLGREVLLSDVPLRLGYLDWPGRKRADEVSGGFLRWLDQHPRRPFFAFLNYWDAHDPYIAPEPFREHWPRTKQEDQLMRHWWWIVKRPVTDEQVAMLRGAYEDCIRALDHKVGQLLDDLESRGRLEDTILIVTSDHGEHFGEHNLFLHGNSVYEPLVHVPLIVAWPGEIPRGVRVHAPVALNGLPNTVLQLIDEPQAFSGASWVKHWTGHRRPAAAPELQVAELASQPDNPPCYGRSPICRHGPMRCIREGRLKYIRAGESAEELYDLRDDPGETNNLIDDPQYAAPVERFRRHFRRIGGFDQNADAGGETLFLPSSTDE